MTPTLQTLSRALLTPDLSFATLKEARAETGRNGLPRLMRTTRFAEARIVWQGRQWLLSMPLSPAAAHRIARTAPALGRLRSEWLADSRLLPGELRWEDASGCERRCDLVLQLLPPGEEFDEALRTAPRARLLAALDALEAELSKLHFTHNNLKAENLRWCDGRWIPLRYHDATLGGEAGGSDAEAFEALRGRIARTPEPEQTVSDTFADYDPLRPLTGHIWTSHEFEGLVCVEDESGYGYVDRENRETIPARYLWADDFHEGRAEVETPTGMGLIDRQGRYILPPEFEIVDYRPAESLVYARKAGQWALFDYLGRPIADFGTINEVKPEKRR